MKKISVIIPIYNVEKYLEKCINSVIYQDYRNLEIILVNDGSTDISPLICEEFAKKDDRIVLINKKNGGLSSARNAGLSIATGDYVYFLDSDDCLEKDMFSILIKYMQIGNDLCIFNYQKVNENNELLSKTDFQKNRIFINNDEERFRFIVDHLLKYKSGWEAWNRIYKMDIIKKYHIIFEDNNKIFAEDLYFNLCYVTLCNSIQIIDSCFYNYLIRDNSIMGNNKNVANVKRFSKLSESYNRFLKDNHFQYLELNYPFIHYLIMEIEISKIIAESSKNKYMYARSIIKTEEFSLNQYKKLLEINNQLFFNDSFFEMKNFSEYYIKGNYNKLRIKNRLCNSLTKQSKFKKNKAYINNKNGKRAYLIGTEDFGNLGDHQIAKSEIEFLNNLGYKNIIEVSASNYFKLKTKLKKIINKNDIICFTGGGNFGNYYMFAENIRRDVVQCFPNNKIVMFPQTMHFSNDEDGNRELENSKKIYNSHNHLILFFREKKSYELAKKHFNCSVKLAPDIVLNSRYSFNEKKEDKVILCLRNDVEQVLSIEQVNEIYDIANKYFGKVEFTDTQLFYNLPMQNRNQILENFFKKISSAKLVITDRLHGMVFCAISGIPCIVFSNFNHKVEGTYEWIKDLDYIDFVNDFDLIEEKIIKVLMHQNYDYTNSFALDYSKLIDSIK